jgi:zinc/manganese transport system substrate-binding protein
MFEAVILRRPRRALLAVFVAVVFASAIDAQPAAVVTVVAAENFYADIARQIGGDHVTVTSILSDPNVDPREYVSSPDDAAALAGAPDRMPDNEHIWYGVDNVGSLADAVTRSLSKLLPAYAAEFSRNDQAFHESLVQIKRMFAVVSARWAGAPIGLTDNLFSYQARPLELRVLTPVEYRKAVSEGAQPPADAAAEAEQQITDRRIRILITDSQNQSAVALKAQQDARAAGIPVVSVSETMPAGATYQSWMLKQLDDVRAALEGSTR